MSVPIPLPWRSVWLPRVAVAVALLAGLPLYLRSPLWCDVTLYDLAARNLLTGGVHYRDVFDTNLPGFVWLLTGLRWGFGFSPVVVRLADLMVVAAVVALLDRLARWGGATRASRWWALAGVAFLYPFAVEMAHAQRDVWMALPALAAVVLRTWRTRRPETPSFHSSGRELSPELGSRGAGQEVESEDEGDGKPGFRLSFLEGVLWGVGVWIKPHVMLMAACTWLLTARRLAVGKPRPWRSIGTDLLGNLAGGLAIGIPGLVWLVTSGTWPDFWNVVSVWNPEYTRLASREFHLRVLQELHWFPPWSLGLIPTVPLAVLSVIDAVPWSGRAVHDLARPGPVGRLLPRWLWSREGGPDARFARGVLAGLYLVWAAQAFFVQRGFMYAHLPETLLMLGLWAAHRWALVFVGLTWIMVTSGLWLLADFNTEFRAELLTVAIDKHVSADPGEERYFVRHPLADLNRMRCWSECWRFDQSSGEQYALWDRLRRIREHEAAIDWEELAEVATFLQQQHVKDGEVIAWHDSPHAIYLMMGLKPGLRFMHTCTAQSIGAAAYCQVQTELAATVGKARFAIADLEWAALGQSPEGRLQMLGPPHSATDLLPTALHPCQRVTFPFNQRAVFRTRGGLGRYTVHALTPPFGDQPLPDEDESK